MLCTAISHILACLQYIGMVESPVNSNIISNVNSVKRTHMEVHKFNYSIKHTRRLKDKGEIVVYSTAR